MSRHSHGEGQIIVWQRISVVLESYLTQQTTIDKQQTSFWQILIWQCCGANTLNVEGR